MVDTRRRNVLLCAGGIAALAGVAALRPRDKGGVHSRYFSAISSLLARAGIRTPVMVIDHDKMLANAAQVVRNIQGQVALRLVAKSLPSLPMLDALMAATGTRRLMVFNLRYLLTLGEQRPGTDLLLGKPLPVAAAHAFYGQFRSGAFDPSRQLQWLVDTPSRLAEYRDLARAQRVPLKVNIEIDVGLHRGGVASEKLVGLDSHNNWVKSISAHFPQKVNCSLMA